MYNNNAKIESPAPPTDTFFRTMISPRIDVHADIRNLYEERTPSQSIPSEGDDSSTFVDLKQRVQELEGMLKELGVKLGDDDTDESEEGSSVHIFTDDPELGEAPVPGAAGLRKSPSEVSISHTIEKSPEELLSQELASVDMTHCLSAHLGEVGTTDIRASIEGVASAIPATIKSGFCNSPTEEGIIFDRNFDMPSPSINFDIPKGSGVVGVSADSETESISEEGTPTRGTIVIFRDKLEIRLLVVYLITAVAAIGACVVIVFYVLLRT